MKPRIVITALAFAVAASAMACDICGVFVGINPNDRASSIALFHRYRLLRGDIGNDLSLAKHAGTLEEMAHYREVFSTVELRADLWFTQRFSLLVSVPLVQNAQAIEGITSARIGGLGDPFVLARCAVVNSRGCDAGGRFVHRVLLGGGCKFPLGRIDHVYNEEEVPHDLQPGTGSWDALASLEYHVRRDQWAASLQFIGRRNGVNEEGMRFGHGLSSSIELARIFKGDRVAWRPFVGAYHEWMGLDRHHGEVVDGTGCSTLFAQAGARAWFGRWSVSLTGQFAVARHDGDMMLPNVLRSVAGVQFLLAKPDNAGA